MNPPLMLIAEYSLGLDVIIAALKSVFSEAPGNRIIVVDRWPSNASTKDRLPHLRLLRELTATAGARLVVKGRGDLALLVGADGLHCGERSIATGDARRFGLPVGRACHDADGLIASNGVDWATLSPVATPISKPALAPPLGVDGFAAILERARATGFDRPVYALGGITDELAARARFAGASGVAVIGAVFHASDPGRAATSLLAAWDGAQAPVRRVG